MADDVQNQIAELRVLIQAQTDEIARLRSQLHRRPEPAASADPSCEQRGPMSRRVFGLAVAGAAASVATLGAAAGVGAVDPAPAGASEGAAVDLGKDNTGATARTGIFSSTSGLAATIADPHVGLPGSDYTPAQAGLVGSGFYGVVGYATDEDGVGVIGTDATPNGSAPDGAGIGVSAQILNPTSESPAMVATTQGGGGALWAFAQNDKSDAAAVWVTNDGSGASIYVTDNGSGTGPPISAWVENDKSGAAGVETISSGTGPGAASDGATGKGSPITASVKNPSNPSSAVVVSVAGTGYGLDVTSSSAALVGTSSAGRGAILTGKLAQVRLVPGAGAHPSSGETGDLYLDSSYDLWLCKGGTTWKQIA